MHDAFVVRVLERVNELVDDQLFLVQRKRPAQRLTFHQLHHDRILFDTIDGRDIGMIERGEHLRLAREPCHAIGILGEGFENDFDCHFAIQLGVGGAPYLAHAASTEGRKDLVRS
jgi:hypothetical protein